VSECEKSSIADQNSRSDRIAVHENFFEFQLLFVELLRCNTLQRVGFSEAFAPAVQDLLKRLLVGPVAQKRAVLAKLHAVIIDVDGAQLADAIEQRAGWGGG